MTALSSYAASLRARDAELRRTDALAMRDGCSSRVAENRRFGGRGSGRRGGGGAAPFVPTQIADLALWLDARDYTPGAITALLDKSTNALAFTGTATADANDINGAPSINFNGTTNIMTSSSAWAAINGKTALTWIGVLVDTDVDAGSVILETSASATANAGTFLLYARTFVPAQLNQLCRGTVNSEYYATDTLATAAVWSGQVDMQLTTGEAALMRKDGAAASTTAVTNSNNVGQTFGNHTLFVGARSGASLPWTGKIGAMLVYSRALSVSEINQVERYLGAIWGITVPLA